MIIGYARVSTTKQDLEGQMELLEQAGCNKDNIYIEKITGESTAPRTALKDMKHFAREGDIVKVASIDRFARSIIDLNKIVEELNDKGVSIKFIQDNIYFKAGEQLEPTQELMFNMLGSFAQFERSLIVQRTTEGRERAKKQGKHMGRPGRPRKDIKRALNIDRKSTRLNSSHVAITYAVFCLKNKK